MCKFDHGRSIFWNVVPQLFVNFECEKKTVCLGQGGLPMDNNAVLLLVLQFCRAQPGGSESAGGGWSCQLSPQKCICLLGQMLRCKVLQPGDRCPALSGCRLSRPKRLPAHPETWTEADVRRQSTQVAARYQVTSDRPIRCLETLGRPMGGPGLRAERPDVKPRGRRSRTVSPVVPQ